MGIAGDDADGVFATTNIKDPLNPAFADDEAMKEYFSTHRRVRRRRRRSRERHRGLRLHAGRLLVEYVLEQPRRPSSRSSLMNDVRPSTPRSSAAWRIDGVQVKTSARRPVPGREPAARSSTTPRRSTSTNVGEVIDFEGKTAELTPADLINADLISFPELR
jgi:hypothetical protein